uniref:leucine-rich repeat protein SHOC-2-like n=1 Tax=Styela clava TaxID=7725 RepID=UPI0019397233|nr:leucine-rich repeat protein SHOC-2-like [Styela clava]
MDDDVELLIEKVKIRKYHCLNVSHRGLTFLPQNFNEIENLKILLLNDNRLVLPPVELLSLCSCLEELVLDNNNFTLLPSGIGKFKALTILSANHTSLGALNPEIGELISLKELWLNDCSLFTIPKEIGLLKRLTKLGLRCNKLEVIPKEIGKLKLLRWVSFAENNLFTVPKEFNQLQELRYASFSGNRLQKIPDPLLNISNLRVVLLSNNKIENVSDDVLLSFASMVKVDLRHNPMIKKPDHWKGMDFILVGHELQQKDENVFDSMSGMS